MKIVIGLLWIGAIFMLLVAWPVGISILGIAILATIFAVIQNNKNRKKK